LIFFINPDEEGLGIVVEDTSSLWPFTVEATCFEESISLPIFNIYINIFDLKRVADHIKAIKAVRIFSNIELIPSHNGCMLSQIDNSTQRV
jgi:hypothetical protein